MSFRHRVDKRGIMQDRTFRLRVEYSRTGRLALLSHLEITHALERMVRRAGLPFALTQGFSPHMRISFGSALPVGIGSTCEIFDLVLRDYVACDKVCVALQGSAPESIVPLSCKYIESKARAASVAYPYSAYEIVFDSYVEDMSWPESLEVVRKGKTNTIYIDECLADDPLIDDDRVFFTIKARERGNLRPDAFIDACDFGDSKVLKVTRVAQSDEPIDLDSLL